jgi:ketosteroid isomerase-like protein
LDTLHGPPGTGSFRLHFNPNRMHVRGLALLTLLAACRPAAPDGLPAPGALVTELSAQFARAVDHWNRGDLDAFLSHYAPDSATSFIDGRRPQQGIDFVLFRAAETTAGGFRAAETTASGLFTLVMERRADGWKILHDHSSSDPK